jgi:hypothetical protein
MEPPPHLTQPRYSASAASRAATLNCPSRGLVGGR